MAEAVDYTVGEMAERLVERVLRHHGYWTTPARTHRAALNEAPLLEGKNSALVQPDILAFKNGKTIWAEVKQKEAPQKVRIRNQLEHGIEKRHFNEYQKVLEESGLDVFLFVYEENDNTLLCLNMAKHTPYRPLNPQGSMSSTGAVMRNYPRMAFTEVDIGFLKAYECDATGNYGT